MQAKDKDKRNFKGFSKRILSGIRRGKRNVSLYGENSFGQEHDESVFSKPYGNENGHEFVTLLKEDLEASIFLDNVSTKVASDNADKLLPSASQTADQSLTNNVVPYPLSPAPRLELGDFMNTSKDSGIDCFSEKNSPEQFVAFSRREAERIRQESLKFMNGSVLETLNETGRSSSEESDTEGVLLGAVGGVPDSSLDDTLVETCEQELDFESSYIEKQSQDTESEVQGKPSSHDESQYTDNTVDKSRDTNNTKNQEFNNGDKSPTSSFHQLLMGSDESPDETKLSSDLNRSTQSTVVVNSSQDQLTPRRRFSGTLMTSMEQYMLDSVENKTDERKSAEAAGAGIECPHLVVSPVAVRSAARAAGHKTIAPTPTPASLYINENSAFAKCKSIKRSVSDVGKGILGKFRHRKREPSADKTLDTTIAGEEKLKYGTKKFISDRLKKINKKKEKLSKNLVNTNESVLIVDVAKDKKLVGHSSDTHIRLKDKSPITKEILQNNRNPVHISKSSDCKGGGKSPLTKEILPDFNKRRLSQNGDSPETIEAFTNSIAEMTSRLCVPGQSSAESIECICDCKRRSSEQECCEKRKTPTPPGVLQSGTADLNKSVQFEIASDNRIEARTGSSSGSICDEETELFDNSEYDSDYSFAGGEDLSDAYTDTETDSDGECSDLSCPDCCSASDRKSQSSQGSSDSDDEKLSKMNSSMFSQCHAGDRDSETSSSNTSFTAPPEGNASCQNAKLFTTVNNSASRHDASAYDVSFRELDASPSPRHLNQSSSGLYDSMHCADVTRSVNGYDSPASATTFSDFEVSPSAYKEFDHMNGDVMYLGNESELFQESFFINPSDTGLSSPHFRLPTETPVSSPRGPDSSVEATPVLLNRSRTRHVPLPFQEDCRRKDTYTAYKPVDQQVFASGHSSDRDSESFRCPGSPVSRYNSQLNTSSLDRSYSQDEKVFRTQQQYSRRVSNTSNKKLNRSYSGLENPNRSFSRSQQDVHKLNSSLRGNINGLNLSSNCGNDTSFSSEHQHSLRTGLNDSRRMNSSVLRANHSFSHLNASCSGLNSSVISQSQRKHLSAPDTSFSGLNSSIRSQNESFSHANRSNRSSLSSSYLQDVMSTPPLDLTMSKLRKDQNRHDKWIGQIYSPADRVLHKNRGMSESDLCRQILDLYVSDAEESGFDFETTADASTLEVESPERSEKRSRQRSPELQYGKYVAPRDVSKETNVDDFTTRVVKKCYQGEARTRRLQENEGQTSILIDTRSGANDTSQRSTAGQNEAANPSDRGPDADETDRSMTEENAGDLSSSVLETSQTEQSDADQSLGGMAEDSMQVRSSSPKRKGKHVLGRRALRDRTNVPLEMPPPSRAGGIDPNSLLEEAQEERQALLKCEKSFDRLTQLFTVHNGQRKVKCLTLNESQNVIKHFPPPKEASRVSWGQTISELDLYRHSPRKTPVKTRPILTQKENNFPYDDDTPSPIVLTKMRKPKPLAKRYKNWPWK